MSQEFQILQGTTRKGVKAVMPLLFSHIKKRTTMRILKQQSYSMGGGTEKATIRLST